MKGDKQEQRQSSEGKHEGRQAGAAAEQRQPNADPEPQEGRQRPARQTWREAMQNHREEIKTSKAIMKEDNQEQRQSSGKAAAAQRRSTPSKTNMKGDKQD